MVLPRATARKGDPHVRLDRCHRHTGKPRPARAGRLAGAAPARTHRPATGVSSAATHAGTDLRLRTEGGGGLTGSRPGVAGAGLQRTRTGTPGGLSATAAAGGEGVPAPPQEPQPDRHAL